MADHIESYFNRLLVHCNSKIRGKWSHGFIKCKAQSFTTGPIIYAMAHNYLARLVTKDMMDFVATTRNVVCDGYILTLCTRQTREIIQNKFRLIELYLKRSLLCFNCKVIYATRYHLVGNLYIFFCGWSN